jgi:hypothetical protein
MSGYKARHGGRQDVHAGVANVGWNACRGLEEALGALADSRLVVPSSPSQRASTRGSFKVEEVGAFRLVELERTGRRLEDLWGRTASVASLEPGVVLDADAGEPGDLCAPLLRPLRRFH